MIGETRPRRVTNCQTRDEHGEDRPIIATARGTRSIQRDALGPDGVGRRGRDRRSLERRSQEGPLVEPAADALDQRAEAGRGDHVEGARPRQVDPTAASALSAWKPFNDVARRRHQRSGSGRLRRSDVRLAPLQHRPEDIDAAPGEGDQSLVVAFSLAPLALVEGAAVRAMQRAEGRLVEDSLQRLVAAGRPTQEADLARLAEHRGEAGSGGQGVGGGEAAKVPASAMSSAVSTAPMPGRLRMRAASGWRASRASSSRSSSAKRLRAASASAASSRTKMAAMRSPGTAIRWACADASAASAS